MDTLRKVQEELGIQIILTSDSETVLRDADPEEVIPVIDGAKVNRPLWIKDQKSAKPVDTGLDAYELAQAVSSRRLVLCSLERKEAELLQKIIAKIFRSRSASGMDLRGGRAVCTDKRNHQPSV